MIWRMAAPIHDPVRRRRERGSAWVFLQSRISPETKELARRGAAARGISMNRYIELLIEEDDLARSYVPPEEEEAEQLQMKDSA